MIYGTLFIFTAGLGVDFVILPSLFPAPPAIITHGGRLVLALKLFDITWKNNFVFFFVYNYFFPIISKNLSALIPVGGPFVVKSSFVIIWPFFKDFFATIDLPNIETKTSSLL